MTKPCALLLFSAVGGSQTFLNGNFEQNDFTTCVFNVSNENFNGMVTGTRSFGYGFVDMQNHDCAYADVMEGDWFLSIDKNLEAEEVHISQTGVYSVEVKTQSGDFRKRLVVR